MKESGDGTYKLIIVERLSLIAVLLFGLISFTTSRMMPTRLTSARNANDEVLAIAGVELGDVAIRNDVDVPIAGGNTDKLKDSEAEEVEVERTETEKVEAERVEVEEITAEGIEKAETERMAAIEAAAEATRVANAATAQRQAMARQVAAREAAAAQKAFEQKAQQEAVERATKAAAKANAAQVDYSKVVYTDDNGINIDSGKTYPVIHYEVHEENEVEESSNGEEL